MVAGLVQATDCRAVYERLDSDAGAASSTGIDARIPHRLSAAADRPVGLAVPESEYLKGQTVQIGY